MSRDIEDFLKDVPPEVRDRLASIDPETRLRMMDRRRKMMESMDDEARSHMHRTMTHIRERPQGPEIGEMAPDFDLAVLGNSGERVRLANLRGKPVGLIFASYT